MNRRWLPLDAPTSSSRYIVENCALDGWASKVHVKKNHEEIQKFRKIWLDGNFNTTTITYIDIIKMRWQPLDEPTSSLLFGNCWIFTSPNFSSSLHKNISIRTVTSELILSVALFDNLIPFRWFVMIQQKRKSLRVFQREKRGVIVKVKTSFRGTKTLLVVF